MTFVSFNYLYDIIHIYMPQLTQMVNYVLKSEILLILVNYKKDFRKWKHNSFDQNELSISILIQIKELWNLRRVRHSKLFSIGITI